ncbi:FAR1 DNA binding domain, zinc finger, SWIM-type, MULE transposase domain containing protein [Tanacetum coccineum]
MCTYLKNMAGFTHSQLKNKSFDEVQKAFDKTMGWIDLFVSIDSKVVKGGEVKKHMEIVADEEEIAVDAIPLATKPPIIVDWKIIKEGKMGYFQLIRADESSRRPEEAYERVLWGDLKVMFKPDIESDVWRNLQGYKVTIWKLFSSSGVQFVRFQNLHIFMPVEKKYPLTPATITAMLNKKLQADHWNEICYNEGLPILRSFGIQKASPKGTTIHWIPDVDESIKPILFTKYKSIDATYESYKEYGIKGGFEVRKSTQEKTRHEVSHKWIVFSIEGFLPEKKQGKKQQGENKDDNKKQKRNRPSSRCGCKAKICLRLTRDKKYELYCFEEKHNHSLVYPDDRHYLYGMRFVPFTGIDNHQRSVNFGAALLHTEATGSFKWILTKFKEVFLREPKVVVTDQDPAMKVAMETIFVNTRHRFCMWHITEKLTAKFHLEDNKWLSDMFELREKWIPAYFRDMPLSGLMRTTSCSESENHMFGKLLNSDLTLVEFLVTLRPLFKHKDLDKEKMIMTQVFVDVVQKEMLAAVHACFSIGVVYLDESRKYTILDTDVRVKTFDDNGDEIISGHYLIEVEYQRRWTRDCVPVKSSESDTIRHGLGEVREQSSALIRDIYYTIDAIINRLLSNNTKLAAYKMVQKELLEKADAEMENQPVTENKEFIHALLNLPEIDEDDDTILPCEPINTKGGRKILKNAYEKASSKKQSQIRRCTKCGKTGHNSRTCD